MDKLKIIKYHPNWKTFERAHYNDAGLDCYLPEDIILKPGVNKIPLGFGLQLEDGYMAQVIERSSNAMNGIIMAKAPIDSGYTGEIHAIAINFTEHPIWMLAGERLGQIVLTPICTTSHVEDYTGRVEKTERGAGGFGSTGK